MPYCISRNCFQVMTSIPSCVDFFDHLGIGEDTSIAVAAGGAVRDRSQFVIVVAAMDDELADARRERSKALQVVLLPLLVRIAPVELGHVVQDGKPPLFEKGEQLFLLLEQCGVLLRQFLVDFAEGKDRNVVFESQLDVELKQVRPAHHRPHVRVEMSDRNAEGLGAVDLGAEFNGRFFDLHVLR